MQLSFFLRCVRYIVTESNEARERKEKLERNSWMSWKIKLELCVFSPFAICWRGEESFPFPPLIRTQKIIARSKQQFYGYIYVYVFEISLPLSRAEWRSALYDHKFIYIWLHSWIFHRCQWLGFENKFYLFKYVFISLFLRNHISCWVRISLAACECISIMKSLEQNLFDKLHEYPSRSQVEPASTFLAFLQAFSSLAWQWMCFGIKSITSRIDKCSVDLFRDEIFSFYQQKIAETKHSAETVLGKKSVGNLKCAKYSCRQNFQTISFRFLLQLWR